MKGTTKLILLAGVALVGTAASTQAADKARAQAEAAAIAKNPNAAMSKQPKTMAQSDATLFRTKSGGTSVRVATDLWSTLRVQRDAQGNVHLVESEGDKPATTAEGLPNE